MLFNKCLFFETYKQQFKELNKSQIEGITFILNNLEYDVGTRLCDTVEQAAYILATIKHETAHTFLPIREYGRGLGREYGKKDLITGHRYYGRGYIQLTWKSNYKAIGDHLKLDLLNSPDLALDPKIAYKILLVGLDLGLYGKDLDSCINSKIVDFILARRCVNGNDKANLIASYATKFLICLKEALNGRSI